MRKIIVNYLVVFLITCITALGSISVSVYLPSLPAIAKSLNSDPSTTQFTVTAFLFIFALSQLVYGPLSDRFGRKSPIIAGIIVYTLGSILCALAYDINILIIGRLVQGMGASAGPSLGKAIIRDMYEGSKLTSSLAIVTAAVALSPMLGPFMGGYIDTFWGWRVIFLALVIVAVMLGLTVNFILPETIQQRNSKSTDIKVIFQRYKILIADKEYIFATLCAGCLTAGNFAWNSAAPFVFSDFFHVNADNYGTLSVFVGAGYVTGTISTSFLSTYLTNYRIVYSGLLLSLTSSVLLFVPSIFLSSAWQMLIPMIMYTVGMGIVIPAAAACAMSRFSEIAGSAAGLFGAIQIFIGALGSAIISIFHASSALPLVCTLFAFALLAFYCGQVALFPLRAKIISRLK